MERPFERYFSFAVALALVAAVASPAAAQSDRYANSISPETPETVEVASPHLRFDRAPLNGPLENASMSGAVRAGDLDLRTEHGANQLRWRARDAAQDVCLELARLYPYRQSPGTDCYKTAMHNAMLGADTAIGNAGP
jgi:UrcA family protein